MTQFYNMCDYFGRQRESKAEEKATARKQLQDAMVLQFNGMYGTAVNDPKAWQSLCRALEIEPVPDTLKDCREAVMQTHVNICDLVAAPTLGKPRIFPTEGELAIYTRKTGKIFPRNNVHAGTLLRYLLRRIFDPPSP
ncbi:hypothetical protein C8Q76DRAFT_767296 [Earliella scabrosa]|nr:hypothetical protein C8Q76DRAFT_767296 [Earliella scabrosa]